MYAEELVALVKDAVRASLFEVQRAHPSERLAGFALCTDDSAMSLVHAACTHESLDGDAQLFTPTDWPYDDGAACFDEAHASVAAHYRAAPFEAHVRDTFAALVAALREVREERVFADDVLLIVCSTDPSAAMLARERDAVRVLNNAAVVARYDAALG